MAQCSKTPGCVLDVPNVETGPCRDCAGFKVVANPDTSKAKQTPTVTCATCAGTGTVVLLQPPVDAITRQPFHAGPCRTRAECLCERGGQPIPGKMCDVHNARAKTPDDIAAEAARAAVVASNPPAPGIDMDKIIAAEKAAQAKQLADAQAAGTHQLAAKVRR